LDAKESRSTSWQQRIVVLWRTSRLSTTPRLKRCRWTSQISSKWRRWWRSVFSINSNCWTRRLTSLSLVIVHIRYVYAWICWCLCIIVNFLLTQIQSSVLYKKNPLFLLQSTVSFTYFSDIYIILLYLICYRSACINTLKISGLRVVFVYFSCMYISMYLILFLYYVTVCMS